VQRYTFFGMAAMLVVAVLVGVALESSVSDTLQALLGSVLKEPA
jgi:hypothetical protein